MLGVETGDPAEALSARASARVPDPEISARSPFLLAPQVERYLRALPGSRTGGVSPYSPGCAGTSTLSFLTHGGRS